MSKLQDYEMIKVTGWTKVFVVVNPTVRNGNIYARSVDKKVYRYVPIEEVIRLPDSNGYAQILDLISDRIEKGNKIGEVTIAPVAITTKVAKLSRKQQRKVNKANRHNSRAKQRHAVQVLSENPIKK